MTQRSNVVPSVSDVTEDQFHGAMIAGLGRAEVSVGSRKALAYTMDVSPKQLGNIFAGAAPHPKRLWDALAVEPTALDDIARLYGKRMVDQEAVCDTDDASLLIARLLVKLQEAEHPDSPGGRNVTHSELLGMEGLIRQLHGATGNWLNQIEGIRRPRSVA